MTAETKVIRTSSATFTHNRGRNPRISLCAKDGSHYFIELDKLTIALLAEQMTECIGCIVRRESRG